MTYHPRVPRDPRIPLPGAPDPWVPSAMPPFRTRPPYLMTEMIAAEPWVAERLVHRLIDAPAVEALIAALRRARDDGEPVVVTGCGTSEHAAAAIARLLDEAIAPEPGREHDAVNALEHLGRPLRRGLLIGVSHEGGTRATNEALGAARVAGARTALVTVGDTSPGAQLADIVVRTDEQDQSWCHTIGYLSPIMVGVVVAARLAGRAVDVLALRSLLDVTNDPHGPASTAAALAGCDRLIVAGSGPDHVSARELALKIAEGARQPAAAHDLESVLHGHLAAATRWTGMVVVATDGATTGQLTRERIAAVLEAARLIGIPVAGLFGEEAAGRVVEAATPAGRIVIPAVGRVDGVAASLLGAAIPLQLLAERLARARGVDPDTLGREDPAQAAAHA